jgi:hypothetical protein
VKGATKPRCFYNQPTCSVPLSREHIISAVVFREVFGDPVRNVVSGEFLFGGKSLIDLEPTIRDVCKHCKARLSPYDAAGVDFARQFIPISDPTGLHIKFNREAIGWLITADLNRQPPKNSGGCVGIGIVAQVRSQQRACESLIIRCRPFQAVLVAFVRRIHSMEFDCAQQLLRGAL